MSNRIIQAQPLISTNMDCYGIQLTYDELVEIAKGIPNESVLNDSHDETRGVLGVMRSPRLAQLPNGIHAIVADVEYYREPDPSYTGFSFTLVRDAISFSKPDDIEFKLLYDFNDYSKESVLLHFDGVRKVQFCGMLRRGADNPDLIHLIISGIIGGTVGTLLVTDAYNALKEKLCSFLRERQAARVLLRRKLKVENKEIEVIVEIMARHYNATNDAVIFEEAYNLTWERRSSIKLRASYYWDSDLKKLVYASSY